jgi:hypothetical protein
MDKKELKARLDEVKNLIKTNSKDAHFAESLISELLSLNGQIKHEPTLVHIPLESVLEEAKGDTFTMSRTKDGKVIYHTYGGYTIIADSSYSSLADTINASIDYLNGNVELDDDQKEIMNNDILATTYLLNLPMFAMGDYEFKYKLASETIDYLTQKIKESEEAELQEETFAENEDFENAVKALADVQEALKES